MPWRECYKMDERLRFMVRLLEGEKMAVVCREFDISRKTGYKIFERYKDSGLKGLTDRSRRPYRHANRLPFQVETLIVQLKKEHPSWGAPKIREKIRRLHTQISLPAISTVHAVLDRHGLVSKDRGRRRYHAQGTTLTMPTQPNDLWCADYKGEFMLADKRYCYPLTITDFASRYLLCCDALESTKEMYAFGVFERAFQEFGLPLAIRTDNGVPFASPNSLFGLSKLSVWWLRLGIGIERIKPGNPQQNEVVLGEERKVCGRPRPDPFMVPTRTKGGLGNASGRQEVLWIGKHPSGRACCVQHCGQQVSTGCLDQLTVKDLEDVIGRPNRVYEVLSYLRSLTLPMIQRLHSKLGIPAESLIKPSAGPGSRSN